MLDVLLWISAFSASLADSLHLLGGDILSRLHLTYLLTLWKADLSLPWTTLWTTHLTCAALVNKLVPCAWLLSGALEILKLRLTALC